MKITKRNIEIEYRPGTFGLGIVDEVIIRDCYKLENLKGKIK